MMIVIVESYRCRSISRGNMVLTFLGCMSTVRNFFNNVSQVGMNKIRLFC